MSMNVELLRKAERIEELFGDRPPRICLPVGSGEANLAPRVAPRAIAGRPSSTVEAEIGTPPSPAFSGGEEDWRGLAEHVVRSRALGMQASLGVVSIHRGESAAAVVEKLARLAYSRIDNPLLLVESSFGRPSLASICGVPPSPGLAELLLSPEIRLSSCIHHVPGKDLWVLPAGDRAGRMRGRDWNRNFPAAHRRIAAAFRHAIYELPSLAEEDYALELYALAGRVLLVAGPAPASAEDRNRAARRFARAGIGPLATISADPVPAAAPTKRPDTDPHSAAAGRNQPY